MNKILVIEDNEQNMYLIDFILRKHGFEVIQAINGQEGINRAVDTEPDLIIMDWQLPDINGIEVTKELKKKEALKKIPIVFCSSNVMKGDREIAFEAGASGYIEKPIIPEEFIEEIKKYFQ